MALRSQVSVGGGRSSDNMDTNQANIAAARSLHGHPVASELRALREGRLWALDANSYFSRPAPRVVRGGELLPRLDS